MSEPSTYDRMRTLGASPALIAGYDLLTDDRMDPDRAAALLVAAERSGRNPEAFARHLLTLRKAARGAAASQP